MTETGVGRETITRFPKGATQDVKAEFAKWLITALDGIGVEPGDHFYVARVDHVDGLEVEAVTQSGAAEDARRIIGEIEEALEDHERGILTLEELHQKVQEAGRWV